jgi:glucose-6-phosphate isomerase
MKSTYYTKIAKSVRSSAFEKSARAYTECILRVCKEGDYTQHESSGYIAGDDAYQSQIQKSLRRFKGIRHVVLVGIGGSSLGTEAVYHALSHAKGPKLHVFDQITIDALSSFRTLLQSMSRLHEVAIVIVSKSGSTTETMMNGAKIIEVALKHFGHKITEQIICIGNDETPFMKNARKHDILTFTIPDIIGGRYSLFTAVGMVPLTLLGINTAALRKGAIAASLHHELREIEEHACTLARYAEHGVHTINFFTFNTPLAYCGLWYRQLLAESVGKKLTKAGTQFTHQLLPITSTSEDLHSMAQLYLAGYPNLFTHFVYYTEERTHHVQKGSWLLAHVPFLRGRNFGDVQNAIREGVLQAYTDQKFPYRKTELQKRDAYEIGFLLSSLMFEVMYVAHLFDVDAFDQPSVELYKAHTRNALA